MRFPSFDLTGRVALVTGGGRGIGRGIALALANAGADVAICSRTEEQLRRTAAEIEKMGRTSLVIRTDVARTDEINRMVSKVLDKFQRIDILVNAAGVNLRLPATEVTEEIWDSIVDINLKGTFFCCQAVGRVMIEQKKGKIINIGSLTSHIGIPTIAPYAATKSGILALTKTLAIEWAKYNINVNCIGPGYYKTEMTRKLFEDPKWVEKVLKNIPMNRTGTVEDLMGIAVFLVSDASDYITGQIIYVDGGFLAGWKGE